MEFHRSSGALLHPTSLPSPFGIGDLGSAAYRFVDFLSEAGQSWWQVLPLGPTGFGNSPYNGFSAFAGNPILISLERLVEEGLLEPGDIEALPPFPEERVDYGPVIEYKMTLLAKSYRTFKERHRSRLPPEFAAFCEQNKSWLEDYVLFRALKVAHGESVWTRWHGGAATREPETLARWRAQLSDEIQFGKYLEYLFAKQWNELRSYCRRKGIRIIGDIPFYVAHDSAEVWANRELFYLDGDTGEPLAVAGVPPDYFSATGQRWGNPLYRWDAMARTGYPWWIERMRAALALVDVVRIDHFRGFEAYWEIPADQPTGIHGKWVRGPGASLFEAMGAACRDLPVIAEDLGAITPEVDSLRERFGFPGMCILQMAFGDDSKAPEYRPHRLIPNCVVYTATHDHNTTFGWFTSEPGKETTQTKEEVTQERRYALAYVGTDGREIHWDFIRLAMASVANLCIFPLQDILGLGSEHRMNRPGTPGGNWEWRFTWDMLTPQVSERLKKLTEIYERVPRPPRPTERRSGS